MVVDIGDIGVKVAIPMIVAIIGAVCKYFSLKIEKMETTIGKLCEDLKELRAEKKADHKWIENINKSVGDIRDKMMK